MRGGFLGQDGSSPINPYGVAAIAGLVGLFTRHATAKLSAVFDTMLGKPKEDDEVEVEEDPGTAKKAGIAAA
ncbi:MAG: hypothetical protein M3401_00960 [Actinomycetota bacterium]|nr:hypothetical protein [Actinomycetota bacterium]